MPNLDRYHPQNSPTTRFGAFAVSENIWCSNSPKYYPFRTRQSLDGRTDLCGWWVIFRDWMFDYFSLSINIEVAAWAISDCFLYSQARAFGWCCMKSSLEPELTANNDWSLGCVIGLSGFRDCVSWRKDSNSTGSKPIGKCPHRDLCLDPESLAMQLPISENNPPTTQVRPLTQTSVSTAFENGSIW